MTYSALPLDSDHSEENEISDKQVNSGGRVSNEATTPGGNDPVTWEVVAETMGILQAQIIAGRLQSEGIPTRVWQESIGHLYGLTAGPMGTGYVSVPESYVELASEILDDDLTDEQHSDQ